MKRILRSTLAGIFALLALPAFAAPAMWEVSDADSKVVLFGSFHILPENTAWRTPLFDAALAQSKFVYFETDIGPLGMIALTIKMVGLAFQQRPSWVTELTPSQLQLLTDAIKPIGMSLEEVDLFPPWVTTLRLSMSPAIDPEGGSDDGAPAKPAYGDGVDSSLQWELPKERKAYLETATQQYDVLAAGSIEEQIDDLMQLLSTGSDTAEQTEGLDALLAAWQAGDVDAIAATFTASEGDDPEDLDRILYDRNANWIPAIEALLASNEQDLIVVGAAHLAGERSVLDLLQQAGYTVARIQ
jgi:uncharacterized protein YbaP (TraB family)